MNKQAKIRMRSNFLPASLELQAAQQNPTTSVNDLTKTLLNFILLPKSHLRISAEPAQHSIRTKHAPAPKPQALSDHQRLLKRISSMVFANKSRAAAAQLTRTPAPPVTHKTADAIGKKLAASAASLAGNVPKPPPNTPLLATISRKKLKQVIKTLARKTTQDLLGWTADHVWTLYQDPTHRPTIDFLILSIANDELPPQIRDLLLTRIGMQVQKPDSTDFRVVSWGSMFTTITGAYLLSLCNTQFLLPEQLAIGAAGGPTLAAILIQTAFEDARPNYNPADPFVAIKVDISKAYPSSNRPRVLQQAFSQKELAPAHKFLYMQYSRPTPIVIKDPRTREIKAHVQQPSGVFEGETFGSVAFCTYIQPALQAAVQGTTAQVIADMDDLHLVGPLSQALDAFAALKASLPKELKTNNKSWVLFPFSDEMPSELPPAIAERIAASNLKHKFRWAPTLGTVVADFEHPQTRIQIADHIATTTQKRHERLFQILNDPKLDPQPALQLLRLSALPRLHHLLRSIPPKIITPIAEDFYSLILNALASIAQSQTLREAAQRDAQQQPETDDQKAALAAIIQSTLPLSFTGLGLTYIPAIASAAFYAAHAEAAPLVLSRYPALAEAPPHQDLSETITEIQDLIESQPAPLRPARRNVHKATDVVLPADQQFWTFYGSPDSPLWTALNPAYPASQQSQNETQESNNPANVPILKKAQASITECIHQQSWNLRTEHIDSIADPSLRQQHRIRLSSISLPLSHLPLTCPPMNTHFRFKSQEFAITIKRRLGLPVFEHLKRAICKCGKELTAATAAEHILACKNFRYLHTKLVHDPCQMVVVRAAKNIGVLSQVKPVSRGFFHKQHRSKPTTTTRPQVDLELFNWNNPNMDIDLTITHPHSLSHRIHPDDREQQKKITPEDVIQEPDLPLREAEFKKHQKHAELCRKHGNDFRALAMTTYGAFGPDSNHILNALSERASELFPTDYPKENNSFAIDTRRELSQTLHRGLSALLTRAVATIQRPTVLPEAWSGPQEEDITIRSRRSRSVRPPSRYAQPDSDEDDSPRHPVRGRGRPKSRVTPINERPQPNQNASSVVTQKRRRGRPRKTGGNGKKRVGQKRARPDSL